MEIVDVGLKFPNVRQKRASTKGIVIHHLDAQWSVQQVHEAHIRKGWNGIGYNFHVAKDGQISYGRGQEFIGAHTNPPDGINSTMIGIGCEGQYHTVDKEMPQVQFDAIVWLVKYLRSVYGDIPIMGHRDLAATACPGQYFPLDAVIAAVEGAGSAGGGTTNEEEEKEMIYDYVGEDMPEWARATVQKLIDRGYLEGDDEGRLRLNDTMLRILVIHDRAGLYDLRR